MPQTIAFDDGHAPRTQSLLVMIGEKTRCFLQCKMTRLALRVIRGAATFCPLLDKSGQRCILARDGLSAFDPERTNSPASRLGQCRCPMQPDFRSEQNAL